MKARTSVIPFLAIVQGRQSLKWEEFIRPAYIGVTAFVLLFWWAHPFLIQITGTLNW